MAVTQSLEALTARLGYGFAEPQLLIRALTHSSARVSAKAKHDNERLEFLGDRVLGLAMAELISEAYPNEDEGDLARRFNLLVRRQTCAEIARSWGLAEHLRVGLGERSGEGIKETILADACEAVLAAVFLDGGYAAARDLVRRAWAPMTDGAGKVGMDAKTMLQEWAQSREQHLPHYVEISRTGPAHAPRFVAEVRLPNVPPATGEGNNKRAAEQAAARAMLIREGVWTENDR